MLTPLTLGLASAVLIAVGLGLVLRDLWRPGPKARETPENRSQRPKQSKRMPAAAAAEVDPNISVTIVQRTAPPSGSSLRSASDAQRTPKVVPGDSPAFDQLRQVITAISADLDDATLGADGQRWPSVEKRWPSLSVEIDAATVELNALLSAVDMQLGPSGETGWSFKNRGYGTFRRVLLGGRSVAWLRCELTHAGQVTFKTRAHVVEQALLNTSAVIPIDGAKSRTILDGLSKALRPSAEYAAWIKPKQNAEAQAGSEAWTEVAAVATQALGVASAALREAGAELSEHSPAAWDAAAGRQRWPLAVRVGGNLVARVDVDLVRRSLEVSVDNPDRGDLARRRRVDTLGLTPHALAEAIAACAWPTVADILQRPDTGALGYAG